MTIPSLYTSITKKSNLAEIRDVILRTGGRPADASGPSFFFFRNLGPVYFFFRSLGPVDVNFAVHFVKAIYYPRAIDVLHIQIYLLNTHLDQKVLVWRFKPHCTPGLSILSV